MEGDIHDNDDELSFIRLAAVTANVVMRLLETHEQKTERSDKRTGEKKDDVQSDEQSSRYVEHRVRDLREFERRARGK